MKLSSAFWVLLVFFSPSLFASDVDIKRSNGRIEWVRNYEGSIENVVINNGKGPYLGGCNTIGVTVKVKERKLPWDNLDLAHYSPDVSVIFEGVRVVYSSDGRRKTYKKYRKAHKIGTIRAPTTKTIYLRDMELVASSAFTLRFHNSNSQVRDKDSSNNERRLTVGNTAPLCDGQKCNVRHTFNLNGGKGKPMDFPWNKPVPIQVKSRFDNGTNCPIQDLTVTRVAQSGASTSTISLGSKHLEVARSGAYYFNLTDNDHPNAGLLTYLLNITQDGKTETMTIGTVNIVSPAQGQQAVRTQTSAPRQPYSGQVQSRPSTPGVPVMTPQPQASAAPNRFSSSRPNISRPMSQPITRPQPSTLPATMAPVSRSQSHTFQRPQLRPMPTITPPGRK